MSEEYSRRIARAAAAQVAESVGVDKGFDGMQASAANALSDILLRYVSEIGRAARGYSQIARRTDPNVADVLLALEDLDVSVPDLLRFSRDNKMSDEAGAAVKDATQDVHSLPHFPLHKKQPRVPTFADKQEAPPPHIPEFLPAFPDVHTYTAPTLQEAVDAPLAEKRVAKATATRRQAQESLVKLHQRQVYYVPGTTEGQAASLKAQNKFLSQPTWEESSASQATGPATSQAQGLPSAAPSEGTSAGAAPPPPDAAGGSLGGGQAEMSAEDAFASVLQKRPRPEGEEGGREDEVMGEWEQVQWKKGEGPEAGSGFGGMRLALSKPLLPCPLPGFSPSVQNWYQKEGRAEGGSLRRSKYKTDRDQTRNRAKQILEASALGQ